MIQETKEQNITNLKSLKLSTENLISFLNVITFITTSLIIFGIFCLGFFVAPIIFTDISPRPLASEVMTNIFLKYYPFAFVCSLIALGSDSIRFFIDTKLNKKSKLLILKLVCVAAVFVMTAYTDKKILPEINQMRLEQKGPTLWNNNDFILLHKRSEQLGKLSFTVGLIPLIIMIVSKKSKKQN